MNAKLILFLSCSAAVTLAASAVNAAPRGGGGMGRGGGHFSSMSARSGNTFARGPGTWSGQRWSGNTWNGQRWSRNNWRGGNWNGNWRHHRHNNNDIIFIGGLGFPWWWGWGSYPWGGGYPYGYSAYGYPYDYYGYGNYGGSYGYDYGQPGYGYGYGTQSRVAELQRRLARAGYYYGAVDGIMGPQTRRAIRAYERSREYGMTDRY
jgi:hypothetical protein